MIEALLVAQLDAAQIENAILHGAGDLLPLAGHGALEERRDDAKRQMKSRTAVADLGAGDEGHAVTKTGCRG